MEVQAKRIQLLLEQLASLRAELSSVKEVILHFVKRGRDEHNPWRGWSCKRRGWRQGCGAWPTSALWLQTQIMLLSPSFSCQSRESLTSLQGTRALSSPGETELLLSSLL